MLLYQSGEEHLCLIEVVYVQDEIDPDPESQLCIHTGFFPAEKTQIELSSLVHGKKLYVVEDEIFGFFFGIEILIEHEEIVGVVVELSQGERGAKGMDDPEVQFLEHLHDALPAFKIGVAEKGGPNALIDDIDCICVIEQRVRRILLRKAKRALFRLGGPISPEDFQGGFAPWAKRFERLIFRYFFVRNVEFDPASFALNSHCLSPVNRGIYSRRDAFGL